MASSETRNTTDEGQYVTLGIDREMFAISVDAVREILDFRQISRVPNAPPFLMGLIDVRGRGVPVIDLRVKLGLPTAEPTAFTRILVLETELGGMQGVLGLVADRVSEVTALDDHRLEPPPEIGSHWGSDYIRGVGRCKGVFVIVFDIARLFSGDESVLAGMAGNSFDRAAE